MEHTYAQALWKMVASGMDAKKAVHALAAKLEREGRTELMPKIARAFTRISQREGNRDTVVLTVAQESDVNAAEKEIKSVLAEFGIESQDLKTQVDDSMIGGWRLEGRERLVDASYKRQLLDLYQSVTKR